MHYFNELVSQIKQWRQKLNKSSKWAILINADPDALASAMAIKRLLSNRVQSCKIYRINEITRPDNLSMMRYLRISAKRWNPEHINRFTHFAIVDSQPSHHKLFNDIKFDVVIDHHPLTELKDNINENALCIIKSNIGATSTLMTKFLQGLRIRPSQLLATALLYGIRTDTEAFARSGTEYDLQSYRWLSPQADELILRRIIRSEYMREWLPLFSRAFKLLKDCRGAGAYAPLNNVSNADLLVSMADFFTKVHGLRWIAVSGVINGTVTVIFRGDGSKNMGRFAEACFSELGEAGGHKTMARAEFPFKSIPKNANGTDFIYNLLQTRKIRSQILS